MASLANQTISSTYDGLIKTSSDNAVPVSGVQALEDGSGNALALSVGRSGNGVTVSGNLAVDTNTLYVDAADNWVGIGKTSRLDTQTKFQVSAGNSGVTSFSSFGDDVIIENSTNVGLTLATPNNGFASILFADPEVSGAGSILYDHSGDNLRISTNNEERMRIDSSGKVLINTSNTSSGGMFRVRQATDFNVATISDGSGVGFVAINDAVSSNVNFMLQGTEIYFKAGSGAGAGTERMRIDSNGVIQLTESSSNAYLNSNGTDFEFDVNRNPETGVFSDTSKAHARLAIRGDTSGSRITFHTASSINTVATEKMRIDSSGNVGINTSPFTRFTVVGNSAFSPSASGGKATEGIHIRATAGASGNYGAGISLDTGSVGASAIVAVQESADADVNGLAFFTHGSGTGSNASDERMRIDSSGNVGIGMTPTYRLDVLTNGDATANPVARFGTFGNGGSGRGAKIVIAAAGTQSSVDVAEIVGYQNANSSIADNAALGFNVANTSGTLTERMRITSGGFLKASNTGSYLSAAGSYHEHRQSTDAEVINYNSHSGTNPYGQIIRFSGSAPNNTTNWFMSFSDTSAERFKVWSNGNVVNTNNSYGAISDAKLKENVVDASPKLDDLLQVKIRNFNYIGDDKKQLGVVAQELEEVFPSMIDESPDFEEQEVIDEEGNVTKERVDLGTTTKSVKYSVFVPMLVKAMQEQQEIINDLKARIETLEAK